MKTYPPVPRVEDAADGLLESGHIWIQELIDGGQLRFRLRDSGVVEFGDSQRVFGDEIPPQYRHAVRHVRETLDRAALTAAVDDVESVCFVGESTHHQAVDYEFDRMPPVLGLDIFDHDRGAFLPPDATERVFDRLGLATVNTFEREVRAGDFDATPEQIPDSAWYDGPAAGIVLRNKTGDVAKLPNPAVDLDVDPDPLTGDADALAERYVTDDLLRRVAAELPGDRDPDFEAVFERSCETVFREAHGRLLHRDTEVETGEFRSAAARRVREWLDARA